MQKGKGGTQREDQGSKPRRWCLQAKRNEKEALTQIQNPSLSPEPFTSDVKQIRQTEESES